MPAAYKMVGLHYIAILRSRYYKRATCSHSEGQNSLKPAARDELRLAEPRTNTRLACPRKLPAIQRERHLQFGYLPGIGESLLTDIASNSWNRTGISSSVSFLCGTATGSGLAVHGLDENFDIALSRGYGPDHILVGPYIRTRPSGRSLNCWSRVGRRPIQHYEELLRQTLGGYAAQPRVQE
jgi:hypothetical protein